MIVRPKPTLLDIAIAMRGSIVPKIILRLALLAAVSVGAVIVLRLHPKPMVRFAAMPFTLIGLALSIFMSFRNTACYDRWWEGRKQWGRLLIASRAFARQLAPLSAEARAPLLMGLCGFAHGLCARLRGGDEASKIADWSEARDWTLAPNPTDAVLAEVGAGCARLMADGRINPIHYSVLEVQLTELSHVQGACERIKATPLPFAFDLLLHRTSYLFCLLLPFALVTALGWWTPLLVVIVGYTFFGLDALGDEMEDPFGTDDNDLPLDAMVRTIERELLFAMGRTDLPPPCLPVGYLLI